MRIKAVLKSTQKKNTKGVAETHRIQYTKCNKSERKQIRTCSYAEIIVGKSISHAPRLRFSRRVRVIKMTFLLPMTPPWSMP